MSTPAGPIVIEQPHLVPPTISLLTSAAVIDMTDPHWGNGIQYKGELSGNIVEIRPVCDEENSNPKTQFSGGAPVTGTPIGLVTAYKCSTFGWKVADYQARATRQLLATESFTLAYNFWADYVGGEPNTLFNAPLLIDATPPGGPVDLAYAIAYIEQAFLEQAPQWRPMIHMRPFILEAIAGNTGAGELLRKEGNRRYTLMDSLLVADAGYTGTGPGYDPVTDNDEWIYATAPVTVMHGPITVFPNNMAEATDRQTNDVTFYAERLALAMFDYNVPVIALHVNRTS